MNRVISILLAIVVIQLLIFSYIKFIYNNEDSTCINASSLQHNQDAKLEALVHNSIREIIQEAKTLPQSSEYTKWDKEALDVIDKKLLIHEQITKVTELTLPKVAKKEKIAIVQPSKEAQKINNIQKEIQTLVESSLQTNNIKTIKVSLTNTQPVTTKKISKNLVKQPSILQKIEKYAKAKLGNKYVWGATGPNKFDCSGFTKEVFHSTIGVNIPRVSRDQAKFGKLIEFKDLQRGDMVFFDTEKKFTKRVNHVGIYLSNGNFIHASSAKKKVIITSFRKKPFYKRRFLWGRRVISSKS